MEKSSATEDQASNYHVKNVQPLMIDTDMQARLFTLAPGDAVPWHSHGEAADHYFVLDGELTVSPGRAVTNTPLRLSMSPGGRYGQGIQSRRSRELEF
jgi:quercetin dioxygenase-like cupin family protein